ncbi:hypothetical protein [Streptomyces sp. NPDC001604]|uniref:hypothetical protein n=1 Tax=Streptomyces sp. NPDC001604 TaxID=3364593 RepID=UPI00367FE8A2
MTASSRNSAFHPRRPITEAVAELAPGARTDPVDPVDPYIVVNLGVLPGSPFVHRVPDLWKACAEERRDVVRRAGIRRWPKPPNASTPRLSSQGRHHFASQPQPGGAGIAGAGSRGCPPGQQRAQRRRGRHPVAALPIQGRERPDHLSPAAKGLVGCARGPDGAEAGSAHHGLVGEPGLAALAGPGGSTSPLRPTRGRQRVVKLRQQRAASDEGEHLHRSRSGRVGA